MDRQTTCHSNTALCVASRGKNRTAITTTPRPIQLFSSNALPSFAGQLTADDRNRIGAISRKAQRPGVSCTDFDIDDLIDTVDRKLFAHITDPSHFLHHLLPPTAHRSYSLQKDNMVISYLTLNIISIKQFHQSLSF